jgi:hypothetical protein
VKRGNEPVTNFRRSNRIFRIAIGLEQGLDRDGDKVACEKHRSLISSLY